MAAYAAVVSVMNNIELIQNHPIHSFSFDKKQIEHVHENVCFLLEFLESYPHGCSKEGEALESLIASAAHEADDVIESHVVDQIQAGSTLNGNTSSCFFENLQNVIENLDSVKEMAMQVKADGRFKDHTYNTTLAAVSTTLTAGKNVMVGFDDELTHLMDVLTGQQSSLQSISITGMGGMGKTTLAKHVYEHSIVLHHFDIRAWAIISQDFSTRKILSELLSCQGKSTSELDQKTENELGDLLRQKFLWNRRYLIVLDDIWSKEAWDNIKDFFPDNQNGSRIVVTSRQLDVANHLSSLCLPMKFLDDEKSWNLFCEKTFAEQGCPLELEKIGKKIVKKSRGLPLLIVLIGGQLRKSPPMKEYWENVANDITLIWDSGEDEQSLDVLSLSYSYLPAHLKPCFLYMGVFPEDKDISVSMLVKLWIAEGFIKPSKTESLEEVEEGCLKDLADRNLVLVREWTWNGKIKTCNIHDVLRELWRRTSFMS